MLNSSVVEVIQSESGLSSVSKDMSSQTNSHSTEVRKDRQATDRSCCPQSPMVSHSDAECPGALPKQTVKRNSDAGGSKQGVSAVVGKRNFKRFKHDLQQVVNKGKCTAEFQYIFEADNAAAIFAAYLLLAFGDFTEAQNTVSHKMADNRDVMGLWARASSGVVVESKPNGLESGLRTD